MCAEMWKTDTIMDLVSDLENNKELSHCLWTYSRIISHEVKNPLSMMRNILKIIELDFPDLKDHHRWNSLYMYIDYTCNMLDDFSSIISSTDLQMDEVDLKELTEDVYALFEPIATNQNIKLLYEPGEMSPSCILGDYNHLKQAVVNLVKNAIEATSEKGTIELKCFPSSHEYMAIEVKDTGCGIPDKHLNQICCPFVTYKSSGTGLGLTVVNMILNLHKGHMHVESEVNKGSIFTLHLPVGLELTE